MAQNRPPPAFQEYASSMMSRTEYRTLTLAERGLLYSLRLECWVNHVLPNDPAMLARVLGFDAGEIKSALNAVMPHFFAVENGMIVCPELNDYRTHLGDIREKQKTGGRRGAEITNGKRRPPQGKGLAATPSGKPSADSQVEARLLSKAKSTTNQSKPSPLEEGVSPTYIAWMSAPTDTASRTVEGEL